MQRQPRGYDLDLSRMDIEALVTLALEVRYPPAREELERRCEERKDRHIAVLAHDTPLGREDIEDARQEGALWVEEALRTFDLAEMERHGGFHIWTSLERVVTYRFTDFLRRWRRQEKHLDRSRSASEGRDSAGSPVLDCEDHRLSEPEAEARRHEREARMAQALAEVDPLLRRVWELMYDGKSLPEVGEALGISKDAAKRLWWKLRDRLRARVGELPD